MMVSLGKEITWALIDETRLVDDEVAVAAAAAVAREAEVIIVVTDIAVKVEVNRDPEAEIDVEIAAGTEIEIMTGPVIRRISAEARGGYLCPCLYGILVSFHWRASRGRDDGEKKRDDD